MNLKLLIVRPAQHLESNNGQGSTTVTPTVKPPYSYIIGQTLGERIYHPPLTLIWENLLTLQIPLCIANHAYQSN